MVDVAVIILCALLGQVAFKKAGLPGILGMVVAGIALGPSGVNIIDPEIHAILKEFKTVALIVILIRAGLGISKKTLNRVGGPALRMGFIPCIVEGTIVTIAASYLTDLNLYESGMLGFIIAAVSPAVVVPTMLELKEGGFGQKKEVPTLVLAGASLDDVFAITLFGVFAGLAAGVSTNWTSILVGVPAGILLGALLGAGMGLLMVWFFKRYHLRDTMKIIVFLIVAVLFYDFAELPGVKSIVPIAGLLGIMAIGFVILERYDELANRMAAKFSKIWVFAEILLFVYIGAELKVQEISVSMLGLGLVILLIGLIARSTGVWFSLLGSDLSTKEKLFCMIAYVPKATVQAAMGAVPLSMVMDGRLMNTTTHNAQWILSMAVLSILVTAPLGAIGIKVGGTRLLTQE